MNKTIIEIVTINDFTDKKIITKKEIDCVDGNEMQIDLIYTNDKIIELNSNFVTIESLIKEFGEIFEVITSEGNVITVKNNPEYANDWRSNATRTILNYDGINRIAGEPINNYYYGLKIQNIKVNDIICVTSGMITSKVLEVKKTAKGVTFVLDNNRNRNFKNDSIVIVVNDGFKQVNTNIINLVNDTCISLMMEEVILNNNNIDKYKNMVKKYSNKIELYKRHLEILGLIKSETKKEEVKNTNKTEMIEIKETLETKVNNFVKLIQNDHIQRMKNSSSNFVDIVSSYFRKKYILVDLGTSGRYMIDKETQIIYGVKAYGKINKNKIYGTLDTINNYFWGDFYAFKLKEDREINYNNLLTIENLKGKIFETTKSFMIDDEVIFDTEIVENEISEEEKNNLISIAEEYKKEILKDEKIEEEKEEKIFFSIYGEGKTEDIKTYDIQKATHNFNDRVKNAINSDSLGYYKTFIVLAIPELGEKNIKFRYDLDEKSQSIENILKFIIQEEKKELEYFKENMYSFTWIKDKEKYIKQHEELFLILEKYLNENNPIDPDKNKNKENILNSDREKNNLISLNSMEVVESVKTSHAPNSNVKILEFKSKKHDQQEKNIFSISNNMLKDEEKNIFENIFNDAMIEINEIEKKSIDDMEEKNNFDFDKIISFDSVKNKKSNNDLNDYSFDAPSSNKNNSDKKIKMCVCGAILKTEKEKNLNICECCIDYAYSLYVNRQLPPDILKMADELLKQEKKKEYNLMLDELQEEFSNLKK